MHFLCLDFSPYFALHHLDSFLMARWLIKHPVLEVCVDWNANGKQASAPRSYPPLPAVLPEPWPPLCFLPKLPRKERAFECVQLSVGGPQGPPTKIGKSLPWFGPIKALEKLELVAPVKSMLWLIQRTHITFPAPMSGGSQPPVASAPGSPGNQHTHGMHAHIHTQKTKSLGAGEVAQWFTALAKDPSWNPSTQLETACDSCSKKIWHLCP